MSNAVKSEVARLIAAERECAQPGTETVDRVWERVQGRLDGSVPEGPDWLERGEALAKWRRRGLALLLLAGAAGGGAALWAGSGNAPTPDRLDPVEVASAELPVQGAKPSVAPAVAPEEEPPTEAAEAAAPPEPEPEAAEPVGAAERPAANGARKPTRPKPTDPPRAEEPEAPKSTLDAELEAIEQARAALKRGDYATAQRTMEAHPKRFPGGVLGEEAAALATAAKCARSDDATANAVTRSTFDAAHPGSIHARIVRRHCARELDELLE